MFKAALLSSILIATSLSAETKVLAFSGSTRKDSCNKKLIMESARIAREQGATVQIIELKDYPIPFYDADLEAQSGMPENAKKIRSMMMESHAVIIASPEYNGSVSAILKNLIDWLSRNNNGQPSRDAFKDRKFAILSCSPGSGGGSRGLEHLAAIIKNVGGNVILKQTAIPGAYSAFDTQGKLINEKQRSELQEEITELLK